MTTTTVARQTAPSLVPVAQGTVPVSLDTISLQLINVQTHHPTLSMLGGPVGTPCCQNKDFVPCGLLLKTGPPPCPRSQSLSHSTLLYVKGIPSLWRILDVTSHPHHITPHVSCLRCVGASPLHTYVGVTVYRSCSVACCVSCTHLQRLALPACSCACSQTANTTCIHNNRRMLSTLHALHCTAFTIYYLSPHWTP